MVTGFSGVVVLAVAVGTGVEGVTLVLDLSVVVTGVFVGVATFSVEDDFIVEGAGGVTAGVDLFVVATLVSLVGGVEEVVGVVVG